MRYLLSALSLTWLVTIGLPSAHAAPPTRLELQSGDHIAIVGNALADRMQHTGHFETLVVAKNPDRNLVVRNLAVAGDEVVRRHRSENFGSPDDWLTRVKADVILAFFGFNESFNGPDGLARFRTDLEQYIRHVRAQNHSGKGAPRLVLFSPIAAEKLKDPSIQD
ncbi:MAG: hypothetical protein KA743_09560, partial [Geothrix sp.]|nr:hypothetical protein [Geothrix sp.]